MNELFLFLLAISTCSLLGFILPLLPFGKPGAETRVLAEMRDQPNEFAKKPPPFVRLPWPVTAGLICTGVASLASFIKAIVHLLNNAPPELSGEWSISWYSQVPPFLLQARLDNLAAFFLLLIGAFSVGVAVYSLGALQAAHYLRQRRQVAAAFAVFAWATQMVVLTNDVFTLSAMLEIMTLAFGYLSLFKHRLYQEPGQDNHEAEEIEGAWNAPQLYMIISHASTVLLVLALTLLAFNAGLTPPSTIYALGNRAMSFETFRDAAGQLNANPVLAYLIFLLALGGLGIRAGLVPAHPWVPRVHPNSPTTTHALSLGIAIKVAIYLMLRFFFEFLPPLPGTGYLVLALAVITAFVNVWQALDSHDLKTALAYHSVENIGIIVAGAGVALIARLESSMEAIATLALFGALYHLLNHAVFKGLLYLATGAVDNLTAQVVIIDKLGGLVHRYRWTTAFFLIGAFAISGFPLLNGFVSEWLTAQSLLTSIGTLSTSNSPGNVLFLTTALTLLFASFALTAICFYKIAGIAFLGPSPADTSRWSSEHDVPWSMRGVMVVFAALTVILGILPLLFIPVLLAPVTRNLLFAPVTKGLLLENGINEGLVGTVVEALGGKLDNATNSIPVLPSILGIAFVGIVVTVGATLYGYWSNLRRGHAPTKDISEHWNSATGADSALRPASSPLIYLVKNILGQSKPENSEARKPVIDPFSNYYKALFHLLLTGAEKSGKIQDGDIRKPLQYIFWMNLLALIVFVIILEFHLFGAN
ncbi:MAG: proton-conducting transporter membrane subunit [Anaerolineae bacterium]